jgi:hypothetical protein
MRIVSAAPGGSDCVVLRQLLAGGLLDPVVFPSAPAPRSCLGS